MCNSPVLHCLLPSLEEDEASIATRINAVNDVNVYCSLSVFSLASVYYPFPMQKIIRVVHNFISITLRSVTCQYSFFFEGDHRQTYAFTFLLLRRNTHLFKRLRTLLRRW